MPKFIVADDDKLAQGGMAFFLSTVEDAHIVETVSDGRNVIAAVEQHPDTILILDMGLPGRHGLDILQEIKCSPPTMQVIVLTGLSSVRLLRECVDTGADAVLTKACEMDEFYAALEALSKGDTYVGASVQKAIASASNGTETNHVNSKITLREKQVMLAIADGLSSPDIAEKFGISGATVRKHRENLMYKLNLHNTADITAYVVKRGLHIE